MSRSRVMGKTKTTIIKSLVAVFVLLANILIPVIGMQTAYATSEAFAGNDPVSGLIGETIDITDLQISGTGNDNLSVSLDVPSGELEMATTTGLTFNGAHPGVNFEFTGTRNNINTALATLRFTPSEVGDFEINASIIPVGASYNPSNGHLYQVMASADISWAEARDAAALLSYGGQSGYLATITSLAESDFIIDRLDQDGWVGASDAALEGDWRWMVGPEATTAFWSGSNSGGPVGGRYANWNTIQPDNHTGEGMYPAGEDCMQIDMDNGGRWNDLPCGFDQDYYVVEYGDAEAGPELVSASVMATVTRPVINIGSCQDLMDLTDDDYLAEINVTEDIDCEGYSTNAMFMNDNPFMGDFNGNGHTISNFTAMVDGHNVGFIAAAEGASFTDLYIDNFVVYGVGVVGGLVGNAFNTDITNVHATNVDVQAMGDGAAGGLIGQARVDHGSATITNVSSTGSVLGNGSVVGGLIGDANTDDNAELTISEVFSEAVVTVDGFHYGAGGLIGGINAYTEDGTSDITLSDAYAWGDVIADDVEFVGGLVGRLQAEEDGGDSASILIRNTYARGDTSGYAEVAGLIGGIDDYYGEAEYTITDSFATGLPTAGQGGTAAGFIGRDGGNGENNITTDNNYYLVNFENERCERENNLECTPIEDPGYFINNNEDEPMSGWDFEDIWVLNAGIPPVFRVVEPEVDDNGDGIDDSTQPNVASFTNGVSGQKQVIELSGGCVIDGDEVAVRQEAQFNAQDPGFDYGSTFVRFAASDCSSSTTVKLVYYGLSGNFTLRKHNPNTNAYFNIPGASISTQTINGQLALIATYVIQDNGDLDLNPATGEILDPVGLGTVATGVPNTGFGRH